MACAQTSEEIYPQNRNCKLPKSIIHRIMECLPLEGAARMSILSAEWREYWRTIPALVFDDPRLLCQSLHCDDICKTLLQHNGPIVKFVLIIPYIHLMSAAPLILFISTNDLKEFTMIKKMGHLLELPSYIFSCANLTKLTLGRCKFNLPRSFSGFQHLVSIDFETVVCLDLESFVAKCPLLEKLSLRDIKLGSNTFKLDFNMPKLKYLTMSGMLFDSINLDGCQGILSISVSLQKFLNLDENNGTKELIKFLERHSRVESLCFNKYFIKFLVKGGALSRFPATFIHVKDLQLTSIDSYFELPFALGIIQSCPNVERLRLDFLVTDDVISFVDVRVIASYLYISYEFLQLRTICARFHTRSVAHLKIIWYLIARAPMLEVINLEIYGIFTAYDKMKWSRKLRQLNEASSYTVIITLMSRKVDDDEDEDEDEDDNSGYSDSDEGTGSDSDFQIFDFK